MDTTQLPKDTPGPRGSTPHHPPPFLGSNVADSVCCLSQALSAAGEAAEAQLAYRRDPQAP